jgi:hypothetical protein
MFGTVSLPATEFKRTFRNAPFFFSVPISVFLEETSRQDALGATILISLDL